MNSTQGKVPPSPPWGGVLGCHLRFLSGFIGSRTSPTSRTNLISNPFNRISDQSDSSDLSKNTKKPPEKLTSAFLLNDGEIFWFTLSAKIFAAFLISQVGKIGRNPAESEDLEGFSHFFGCFWWKISEAYPSVSLLCWLASLFCQLTSLLCWLTQ